MTAGIRHSARAPLVPGGPTAAGGRKRLAFAAALLAAAFMRLAAENEAIRFTRMALNEGIAQSIVYGIIQDRSGFVWFATENGINRFDGYHITQFRHDPDSPSSLPHNEARAILEDRSGLIWIGTYNSGLIRYDPRRNDFRCYRGDAAQAGGLSGGPGTKRRSGSAA